mmetsp:Transcript_3494/g.9829  ORF Transcript_3494/g.9829 Transcript_3494/m.9829 type:complete len:100 (+) Transcript_3494:1254-1553(+)
MISDTLWIERIWDRLVSFLFLVVVMMMGVDGWVSSVQRLPGLPSSNLVAEALSGKLDDFGFEDVLGHKPEESEVTMPGVHSLMEKRLGVAKAAPSRELP